MGYLSLNHLAFESLYWHWQFSDVWKCSKVAALFKIGDRTNEVNYRPIAIVPTMSKVLEKVVHFQL